MPNRAPREIERVSLREFLFDLQDETQLTQVSFYEGVGFADYLVKGVIADFYALFECNRRLIDHIHDRKLNLRPETYLVAISSPHESDHVDFTWQEFSGVELRLERALAPTYGADLASLEGKERADIARLFVTYEINFAETAFEPFFKDLFFARISRDVDRLADVMSVMHRIEGYAAAFFRDRWIQVFGDKWYNQIKEAAKKVGLQNFDPKKFTLKEAVDVSNSLPNIAKQLNEELGSDWHLKLNALNGYRSDLAHGRVFADPDYLVKNWDGLASAILEAGVVYNYLAGFHKSKVKED